jgi:hypothetical protein
VELRAARKIVVDLMEKHGLITKGWIFEFDRAKQRLGQTNYGLKRITVSRYMASHANEDEVTQIGLHEIAHALVGSRVQAHGAEWKAMAASIGYKGKRTTRNPYAEAQREKAKVAAAMAAPPAKGVIDIGTKFVLPNGKVVTVIKKTYKSYHAEQLDGKRVWRIPFTIVPHLKVL